MIAAAKPISMIKPSMARSVAMPSARRSVLVVRAEPEQTQPNAEPKTNEDGTVFYAGSTFASQEEVRILPS